jgi:hypothetical protein
LAESPRFIEVRRAGAGPVEVLLRSGRVLRICIRPRMEAPRPSSRGSA